MAEEVVLMKGNEAIAHAAIRCGADGYFGYPITPQSEVLETLAELKPWETTGMVVLQAESEVAAINMVYGGAGSGKMVMTSSSSPGVSLKQEGISYLAGAELPCLIVNVMRGGPGLGTIQPSQADYFQTVKGGGHGDYRLIALAPASVQEMADFVGLAFELAFKYRNPAIILADGVIGQMMEKVVLPVQKPRRTDAEVIEQCPWATTGRTNGRKPNVITSLELKPEEMEKILLKLNDIAKESKRVMKIKAAIGVGKIKDELIKVKESFEEAKEALSYRKMSQDGDVIYMEDIDKSEQVILLFDEKAQDKLFTAVKFGKEEDIHAVIRKMKEYLIKADMSSSSYQAYSMSVINALLVFARQQDLEIEEVFDGIPNYLEIMQKYASADTFMEWLEEQCIRLNANQGRERENKAKGIIEEAKQKIQEEFGDPDIGLEKIAAEVGLTQTFFSSLFKKETGMSFVEYLTDTRMKEAMRLLKETSEKIYVVAQKVGYLESGYFSHVFKKKYGMSPIQCRRQGP